MKHNFGAGPGILAPQVLQQAAQGILNFNNTGLSILEISHRSKSFLQVLDETVLLVKELLNIPGNYQVLFLSGGASMQFTMVPQNFLKTKAAYVASGVWANKAIAEAQLIGHTQTLASSADKNYSYIPTNYTVPADVDYLHLCSNNTIYGTQMKSLPNSTVPIVCDMSSDIFSKTINVADYDLIYAGAQKNMGPAGATCVIIKNEFLSKANTHLPSMMRYAIHAENGSMYNTPPCYAIYVCMLTMQWLKSIGGVAAIQKTNETKAALLYQEIDRNALFTGNVQVDARSLMSVCFSAINTDVETKFKLAAEQAGMVGLAGHRLSGGFRASIYNAMPVSSVEALITCMQQFENNYKSN
ncbi:MAG: 3-phosphoserine/phosphohydroxythreonine transaminase [Bacteroidia bacterium]|nr:3-phosphoserine/phosphohydroxythreonine transaminase [Bacteroidia bacterium]HQU99571.1 3-phosphoserine/phosphohydroxythreonine transaminase [Bacteroidia bacterium]